MVFAIQYMPEVFKQCETERFLNINRKTTARFMTGIKAQGVYVYSVFENSKTVDLSC